MSGNTTATPSPVNATLLHLQRRAVALDAYEKYHFGPGVRVVSTCDWRFLEDYNEWTRLVFVTTAAEPAQVPTKPVSFEVRFSADSSAVQEISAIDPQGNNWGAMPSTKYYVWANEDCANVTSDLEEARRWCFDLLQEDRGAYIVDEWSQLVDLSSLTPKELEDTMKPRCPQPGKVQLLYAVRSRFLQRMRIAGTVSLSDLAKLDRVGRFVVAEELWFMCAADVQAALLADSHHQVRSCAVISSVHANPA